MNPLNGHPYPIAQLEIEDKDGARFSVFYEGRDCQDVGIGDEMGGEITRVRDGESILTI